MKLNIERAKQQPHSYTNFLEESWVLLVILIIETANLYLFIILLLFGAKNLPELAKGLGKGVNEFKKASNEIKDEVNKTISI